MMPDDRPRMLGDESRPGHARVAIRINEIDALLDKNFAQIPAPCRECEHEEKEQGEDGKDAAHGWGSLNRKTPACRCALPPPERSVPPLVVKISTPRHIGE